MASGPRKSRHYPRIPGLVKRTKGDVTPGAAATRTRARVFLDEAYAPYPEKPRLISSVHGALERIMLAIPKYAVEDEKKNPLAKVYRDLLEKLPRPLRVVIVTHESVKARIHAWLKAAGLAESATVVPLADHLYFSVWAEDGYVVVEDANTWATYFVEPFEFPRYADSLIADFVANATDLQNVQAPLYFQGGNVLIGDDFFLIGADYPANSMRYINEAIVPDPGEKPAAAIKRLYCEYLDQTRRLIYVGSTIPVPAEKVRSFKLGRATWKEYIYQGNHEGTVQPLFHIDMFISLAGRGDGGRYRVLVGDPRLAADLLENELPAHAMAEVFDNIARNLKRAGFEVIRNPLPLVYVDDTRARERYWYFATSNNALVQIPALGPPLVLMPTYGHGAWKELEKTDRANAEVWNSLGFEVKLLGDFHPFAENLGAVHCIKKYLRRTD